MNCNRLKVSLILNWKGLDDLVVFHYPDFLVWSLWQPISPVALHVSDIQDGVRVTRAKSQRFVNNVIHLHVPTTTGSPHQEPAGGEEAGG